MYISDTFIYREREREIKGNPIIILCDVQKNEIRISQHTLIKPLLVLDAHSTFTRERFPSLFTNCSLKNFSVAFSSLLSVRCFQFDKYVQSLLLNCSLDISFVANVLFSYSLLY